MHQQQSRKRRRSQLGDITSTFTNELREKREGKAKRKRTKQEEAARAADKKTTQYTATNTKHTHTEEQTTHTAVQHETQNTDASQYSEIGELGSGTFGNVSLLSCAEGTFAQKKSVAGNEESEKQLLNERTMLEQLDQPFVIKMRQAYRDQNGCLCLVLQHAAHGDLYSHLKRMKTSTKGFKLEAVRFYFACIVDAVHHLHCLRIAHRDLKPENLLVDTSGYLLLSDFGFAKKLDARGSGSRCHTFVGSPLYMSPEMVRRSGMGLPVDAWALGVVVYELHTGKLLFNNDAAPGDLAKIFTGILLSKKQGLPIPTDMFERTPQLADLMTKLLAYEPCERLTMGPCLDHGFVKEIKMDLLRQRALSPPYQFA